MKKTVLVSLMLCFFFSVQSQIEALPFMNSGVDQESEPTGGKEEFKRFLDYHLVYPKYSLSQKVEGTVIIRYVCNADGHITSYKLVNRVAPDIDAEAERLFKLLLWRPAIQKETAIAYESNISFAFDISHYKKVFKRRDKANPNLGKMPLDSSGIIYTKTDKQALYVRGTESFLRFIAEELVYPDEAKLKGFEGTVTVSFVIETNGFLSNMMVTKSLGGGCDQEAWRILGETKWQPAEKDKKLVRCKMSYSITFKLNTEFHDNSQGNQRVGGY